MRKIILTFIFLILFHTASYSATIAITDTKGVTHDIVVPEDKASLESAYIRAMTSYLNEASDFELYTEFAEKVFNQYKIAQKHSEDYIEVLSDLTETQEQEIKYLKKRNIDTVQVYGSGLYTYGLLNGKNRFGTNINFIFFEQFTIALLCEFPLSIGFSIGWRI